jgi:hypothetical protein
VYGGYTVFRHHLGQPTKTGHFSSILIPYPQTSMAPRRPPKSPQKEGRMMLAINSIKPNQIKTIRKAAGVFKIPRTTLQDRLGGMKPKQGSRAKNTLFSLIEEAELIRWILALERRGFPAYIIRVKRLAETLISRRGSQSRISISGTFYRQALDISLSYASSSNKTTSYKA